MKYEDDVPELGEFKLPYPKNSPLGIDTNGIENGIIIEIEGMDGSGKSSQVKILTEKLSKEYEKVIYINFIHSEYLKNILLKTKWENSDIYTFTFMYMMGLSNIYHREIVPKLKEGYIVLLDRYIYTIISKALAEKKVNETWIKGCLSIFKEPNMKFFINTSVDICLERKKKDNKFLSYWECGGNIFNDDNMRKEYNQNIFDNRFIEYQSIIKEIYMRFINEDEWIVIDGNNSFDKINEEIYEKIKKYIKNWKN